MEPIGTVQAWTQFETGRNCMNSCVCRLVPDSVRALPQQLGVLNVGWWVDLRNTSVNVMWIFSARRDRHGCVEF
jgi:hypothetical protein